MFTESQLLWTLIVLVLILIALMIVLMIRSRNHDDSSMLLSKIDEMKADTSKVTYEAMLKFNQDLNRQLMESFDKSGNNITEFRLKVNESLVHFEEKISTKLNADMRLIQEEFDKGMLNINQRVEERLKVGFEDTSKVFVNIAERVKIIDEAQKKIEGLSTEMISLQNILTNNQARGTFGEYQLNHILFSMFGDNSRLYETQYTLKTSIDQNQSYRADAVIFMPEPVNRVVIDSKFPFSSYRLLFESSGISKEEESKLHSAFSSEVKKHITDIHNKYIIPNMTADFAVMFVPSDGILSFLHAKLPQVVEYAQSKNVTICSPSTIVPLILTFKSMMIDYNRKEYVDRILKELKNLTKEFKLFEDEWTKLNRNIQIVSRQSNDVNSRIDKITTKFETIEKVDIIAEDKDL